MTTDETQPPGSLAERIAPRVKPTKPCLIVIRGRSMGLMVELEVDGPTRIGRDANASLALEDISVSRRHAEVRADSSGFTIHDLGSTNGLFVNGVRTRAHLLRDGDRIQVGAATILKFCFQDDVEVDYQRRIYESTTRDALTRARNRRFFGEALEVDFAHAQRNGSELSLLLIDIDHFKSVNDRLGHVSGDDVLRGTAATIQQALRPEDILARYGGEEFAVLLRFTDAHNASQVAERVRRAVEAQVFDEGADAFRVTISVGLSTLMAGNLATSRELIETADAALYEAKQAGRNCVVARVPGARRGTDPPAVGATTSERGGE